MKPMVLIFYEFVLILSSVLIFRSFWMFMDYFKFFNSPAGLGVLLILGLVGFVVSLTKLNRTKQGKE